MTVKNMNLDLDEPSKDNSADDLSNELYFQLFLEMSKELGENIFLKGSILLGNLLPRVARSTKDLDCSILNTEIYNSHIVPCLDAFAKKVMKPGWTYKVSPISNTQSGGIKIYNADSKTIYSVDVSVSKTDFLGVTFYNIRSSNIFGSSVEKILADKCVATLSRRRYRRVKDFYDLYIILRSKLTYNVEDVVKIMLAARSREEITELLNNVPFSEEVVERVEAAWVKLDLKSFSGHSIRLTKPEILQVLFEVYRLYDKLKIALR